MSDPGSYSVHPGIGDTHHEITPHWKVCRDPPKGRNWRFKHFIDWWNWIPAEAKPKRPVKLGRYGKIASSEVSLVQTKLFVMCYHDHRMLHEEWIDWMGKGEIDMS